MTAIDRGLEALAGAGIPVSFRRAEGAQPSPSGEVDVAMDEAGADRAEPLLRAAGLHRLVAPGHDGHRFFVGFEGGRWLKLDVKTGDRRAHWPALARRRPIGWRRRGPVVAILGPDGAGKGTVIDALTREIPVGVTRRYFGSRRRGGHRPEPDLPARRRPVRETLFVLRKAARAWGSLLSGYAAAWRGHIVLCDRHPIEVLAIRPDRARPAGGLERMLAGRLTPRPDAIVILEAPADVLAARKDEHPVATLERWRRAYVEELRPLGARVVSTAGTVEEAVAAVSAVVWESLRKRRGW